MIYLQLFLSFLKIGAFSFGGGYAAMPMIQQQVVDVYHWLSVSEFGDLVTISQMTPGPIAINAATFVGIRVAGWQGSIMCNDGMCIPCVCDRDSNCLFLCKISSYGRNTNGVKYFTSCGDRTDLDFWNYDSCTGIFQGSHIDLQQINWIQGGIFIVCIYLLLRKKKDPIIVMLFAGVLNVIGSFFIS